MIAPILLALSAAAAPTVQPAAPPSSLPDIEQAIRAGRLEQAQLMVGRALAAGVTGVRIDAILADLAFVSGKNDEALVRYQNLLDAVPGDPFVAERAGIAALKIGNVGTAVDLLNRATKSPMASWRAWDARGVAADIQGDWTVADAAYTKAANIAPDEADILNNQGWSRLLRGDWANAIGFFARAAARAPNSKRIANNLELAQAALSSELPRRKPGEDGREWAVRLNDAGVAAELLGDKKRAIAAFAQALEASGSWYERAANNLQAANSK